ncbi:Xanthan lyase precursor [Stieleria neptunia]|uniref:Xanthan lyase n=2 Tax=Stieleria neptunia TaxID=2527979 RepID=A0A518HHE3_9BACT|nr:Xanthan lyase precursor [Stieleria neptunia]
MPNPWCALIACFISVAWLAAGSGVSTAAEGQDESLPIETDAEKVQWFETKIRPALIEHCLECHSTETEASGGLVLDSRDGWQSGGDLGPAIVPGDAAASRLIEAIAYDDPALEMPPDGKLDDVTIAAFRRWVQDGAVDPRQPSRSSGEPTRQTGLPVERAHEHWAYRRIAPSDASIDAWIDRDLARHGLTAAPPAEPRALVRRLTFDLHGLPPSPQTLDAFLADPSPRAYERLVDRLLASPHFAEHFARRWMDVVRYAESITLRGFILPEAWRYRDYLIWSYANDRPFDQMIRDQIAGDLLACDDITETQQRAIATGFLALGNSNLEDQDKTKLEFDHIDEQLETIGRAFLAQTIGCARCHDHKFDPIPTRDYYALAGIMRSTTPLKHANLSKWIEKPLPLDPADEAHYRSLQTRADAVAAELKTLQSLEKGGPGNDKRVVSVDTLAGVVVDDADASDVGTWTESTFVKPYVGAGYRHDGTTGQGSKSVTFDPVDLPTGRYEVRLSYTSHDNRATNVVVKVFSANESTTVRVNQRRRPPIDGLWISLGVFPFEKEGQSFVIVSNENADGCVIVDAVQFLPVDGQPSVAKGSADAPAGATTDDVDLEAVAARRKTLSAELKRLQSELNRRPKYLTVSESEPREEIAVRVRGNVHQLGDTVRRGFLSAVGPAQRYADRIGSRGSGRVELAEWIADPSNPLTARVYANRVWSWLMGEGLVATENNFGTTGEPPSHPELLDALAAELIDHDWSTKSLVRTIVCSEAYRRAVTDDARRIAVDPNNRLYASGSVKRIPVEALRDAMLCVSGEIEHRTGGSTIRPGTSSDYNYKHDSKRRSLYLPVFRNSLPPLFGLFDFADSSVSVGQRGQSTVAPQSLAMMNHTWIIDRARQAGKRWLHASADGPAASSSAKSSSTKSIVEQLYLACYGRRPDADEMQLCLEYLGGEDAAPSEDRLADLIQSLFASIDFRYLE